MQELVLGIDPGREKCGLAVVHCENGVLHRSIVDTVQLAQAVSMLVERYNVLVVVMGNGTSSKQAGSCLQDTLTATKLIYIDEYRTTDAARSRYWREHPPRGWRRLLPVGMQLPPVPVDDYAAVVIAEIYFAQVRKSVHIIPGK